MEQYASGSFKILKMKGPAPCACTIRKIEGELALSSIVGLYKPFMKTKSLSPHVPTNWSSMSMELPAAAASSGYEYSLNMFQGELSSFPEDREGLSGADAT